jgi:hypothetical protein
MVLFQLMLVQMKVFRHLKVLVLFLFHARDQKIDKRKLIAFLLGYEVIRMLLWIFLGTLPMLTDYYQRRRDKNLEIELATSRVPWTG